MRVAFLHLGRAQGGVGRYGRILADAASRSPTLGVIQVVAGEREATLGELRRAARAASAADVVQVQWKSADWGGGIRSLGRLGFFMAACRRPVVATLHDVYPRLGLRRRWLDPGALALRLLGRTGARLVVHSEEERRRLLDLVPPDRVAVVPHFAEERPPLPDAGGARRSLGVADRRVVTLLGHMTRRKGHRLVLEALATLPADVVALFAGAPLEGRDAREQELRGAAAELGVEDRVRFLGHVPEEALAEVLAATDVSVSPFRDMSASGAVSTWISAERPIVASDLPAFREYETLVPGSIRIFAPLTADALASAVDAALEDAAAHGRDQPDPRVAELHRLLATPRIVERYESLYRDAVRPAPGQGSGPPATT
jgi:glycosyltransferase involved in cell wall biosynthesis